MLQPLFLILTAMAGLLTAVVAPIPEEDCTTNPAYCAYNAVTSKINSSVGITVTVVSDNSTDGDCYCPTSGDNDGKCMPNTSCKGNFQLSLSGYCSILIRHPNAGKACWDSDREKWVFCCGLWQNNPPYISLDTLFTTADCHTTKREMLEFITQPGEAYDCEDKGSEVVCGWVELEINCNICPQNTCPE